MRSSQQPNVTLPDDMIAELRAKVASGDYADESDVIRAGLQALEAQENAADRWLRDQALASYDAYRAEPQSGLSLKDVTAGLVDRHRQGTKRG